MEISRRKMLGMMAGTAALAATQRTSLVFAQSNSITVTTLGGRWEQSIRTHFAPFFKKKTGADVKIVLGGPAQWTAQIESQPNRPPLDAVDNSEILALSLIKKGLVLKLTPEKVPNLRDIPKQFYEPWDSYGVSYQYGASGIWFDKRKVKQAPDSWPEFLERAGKGEFGKNIAFPDISYAWTPELIWHLAVSLGGSMSNLDPAFQALRKMKPYVTKFWGTAIEAERLIVSREAEIGWLWDGRIYAMMDSGDANLDFKRLAPSSLFSLVPAQVVKGPNADLAFEWVNTLLDPEPLLEYYKLIQYTPTNTRVVIPEATRHRIMPVAQGTVPGMDELTKATPGIIERWNAEIR
ncbi:extracellular solute-binding protein [Parapusillimonas granuli]|uniref:Extracellular solute-binding protein n=1 Tax=Parapusillimonas granuli TaxID=380911 RepID=A0A853FTT0_9BURK|nr:extracellular solute-binding protein [Parapusillimonas granuli]MBB5216606.1 putative spermidine/putrescine transport system substrate-binding protein [Parapusillimonas granuli]MEB2399653.1 extracellular solute-binding protein [Alcaligenaceae bacterium]NYT48088.1 extracellular solute-binding protein [Parapusillimonas granuli]